MTAPGGCDAHGAPQPFLGRRADAGVSEQAEEAAVSAGALDPLTTWPRTPSAIRRETGSATPVARVEPDTLVTIADIAERLERSEESVRLLIVGKRGPGRLPVPVARLGRRKSRLWRWTDVLSWMNGRHEASARLDRDASVIEAINGALAYRRASANLQERDMREIALLVVSGR